MHKDGHLDFVDAFFVVLEHQLDHAHKWLLSQLGLQSVERVDFDELEVQRQQAKARSCNWGSQQFLLSLLIEDIESQVIDVKGEGIDL